MLLCSYTVASVSLSDQVQIRGCQSLLLRREKLCPTMKRAGGKTSSRNGHGVFKRLLTSDNFHKLLEQNCCKRPDFLNSAATNLGALVSTIS